MAMVMMKEKAINAANDTNTDKNRATIQKEIDQSIDQLEDNANVTFNNKILFDGSADVATDVKQTIVKALNSEWIDSSLQLVKDTYGISFQDDSAVVKNMDLQFVNTGGDDLASVNYEYNTGTGVTTKLTLNVNMDYYANLNQTDPNGSTTAAGAGYLDRTLAHEFTHAVMAMKRFMSELVAKGGTQAGVDSAISAATKGGFATESDALAAFKADLAAAPDTRTFLKESCDIDVDNTEDTGSATGSKSWNGEEANAEDVVLEGLSTRFWWYPGAQQTTIEGLTMDWGDYKKPDLTNAGFRFQVGTKANQNIFAAFSDIHANALGLRSDTGNLFSVQTRADAKRALTIFDRALRKSLDQATTIGALVSRLSYTSSNLTTAAENVQASESTIRDADMAKEMTEYTKSNVLAQSAQSMLAQANQNASGVLSLLQ